MEKEIINFAKEILNSENIEFAKFENIARELTNKYFSNNRVLFNPIYLSNICDSDCPYCGYRKSNKEIKRFSLEPYETLQEVMFLKKRGIEQIIFLAGEYKEEQYIEMIVSNLMYVLSNTKLKWVGVEIASLSSNSYKRLLNIGVSCVTLFQETYNFERYKELHKFGIKSDFQKRINSLQAAAETGFKEVGLGVLFDISDWYFDVISMINHGFQLLSNFPDIQLRFSFPRLTDSNLQDKNVRRNKISEEILYKIIITIRNCFPKAILVLTSRESHEFLFRVADFINVLGNSGSTTVGGYTINSKIANQFELQNNIAFEVFKKELEKKYIL